MISLEPIQSDAYWAIPNLRERQLQTIGDIIAYWLKWRGVDSDVHPDAHVMLQGPGAPPTWPSVGQLAKWLEVLRDSGSDPKGEAGTAECGEGKIDG